MSNRTFSYSDTSSRDVQKGKSFRFSEWNSATEYFNDDYIQDWVAYQGALYACKNTNINEIPAQSDNWILVVSGVVGPEGEQGKPGGYFTPHVDAQGNLSWTNNLGLDNPDTVNIKGQKGDTGATGATGATGKQGEQGEQGATGVGVGLNFMWDGTKLGVKREDELEYKWMNLVGGRGETGPRGSQGKEGIQGKRGIQGEQGERGLSIQLQAMSNGDGHLILAKRYEDTEAWDEVLDLEQLRGKPGKTIIVERNPITANIEYRYEDEPSSANKILIYKSEIIGPQGQSIAKCYVADDGYLYIWLDGEDLPRRAGYVRGDKGGDGREIVLRVDNDKNLGPGEAGTGTHLQWKYAGDEYKLWTNLVQINDLMNIALAGLKLEHETVVDNERTYDKITLASYETAYNEKGELVLTSKIANISEILIPIHDSVTGVNIDSVNNELIITVNTAEGEKEFKVPLSGIFKAGDGLKLDGNTFSVNIDTQSQVLSDKTPILQVDQYGLRIKGLIDKLVKDFKLAKGLNADQTVTYYLIITADNDKEYQVALPGEVIFSDVMYVPETKKLIFSYLDDPRQTYHTKEVDLSNLFNKVLEDGGLGMTEDGALYIKEGGITESMLSEELSNLFVNHVEQVTYLEFVDKIEKHELLPGFIYMITDYQTIYQTSDNLILGPDSSVYPSEHWTIQVQATSNSTYDPNGIVVDRSYLHIYYDHAHKISSDKGQILAMHDHIHNVNANYDFVNTRFAIKKEDFKEELTGMEFPREVYYIPTFAIFNGADFENRYDPKMILDTDLRVDNHIIFYLIPDSGQSDIVSITNASVYGNALLRAPITTGFNKINLKGDFTFAGPINHSDLRGTFTGRGEIESSDLHGSLVSNNFVTKISNSEGMINLVNNLGDINLYDTHFCMHNEVELSQVLSDTIKAHEHEHKEVTDTTIRYVDEDVLTEQIIKF